MQKYIIASAVMLALVLTGPAYGQVADASKSALRIANNAITSSNIKNGTIKSVDISKSAKRSLKGVRGSRGPAGAPGATGAQGPVGASGITDIVATQGNGVGSAIAYCPAGMRPISGGGIEDGSGYLWLSGAIVENGQTGWAVAGNPSSSVTAFAYCSAGVASLTLPNGTRGRLSARDVQKMAARRR